MMDSNNNTNIPNNNAASGNNQPVNPPPGQNQQTSVPVNQRKPMSPVKRFLIIIFVIVCGFGVFDTFFPSSNAPKSINQAVTSQTPSKPAAAVKTTAVPSVPTVEPTNSVDILSVVKSAFAKKYSKPGDNFIVEIEKTTDKYASGQVYNKVNKSDGFWYAAEAKDGWTIVYEGKEAMKCTDTAKYNFPADLLNNCTAPNELTPTK